MGGYAQGHVCQENGPGVCLRLLNTTFGHLHALSPQTSKLSETGPCRFCAFSLFSDGHYNVNISLISNIMPSCCIPVYTVDLVPHCHEAERLETSVINWEIS